MMTKQAELKKQAYASTLKSRALSVLIYLIDRSNKELTCFPAIPTMAEQLHISVSTVKRALHELLDAGYIKKDARFREKNKGQTSNLYTLVLLERKPTPDGGQDFDCDKHAGMEPSGEIAKTKEDGEEQEMCQVEHISFDTIKEQNREAEKQQEGKQDQENREYCITIPESQGKEVKNAPSHREAPVSWLESSLYHFVRGLKNKRNTACSVYEEILYMFAFFLWTGEGASLVPP